MNESFVEVLCVMFLSLCSINRACIFQFILQIMYIFLACMYLYIIICFNLKESMCLLFDFN